MAATLPGYKLFEYTTPLTTAASPLVTGWVETTGFTNLVLSYVFTGGTTVMTVEGSFDGSTLDTTMPYAPLSVAAPSTIVGAPVLATAPAINTLLSFVSLIAGTTYAISWAVQLEGTPAAGTDDNNFQLFYNAGSISVAKSLNPATVGFYPQAPVFYTPALSSNLLIRNPVAGTAGAIYSASISAVAQAASTAAASPQFAVVVPVMHTFVRFRIVQTGSNATVTTAYAQSRQ